METRMYRLSRVTGLEGEALAKLGDEFRGMAASMAGVPLDKVFRVAEMGAKLGIGASGLRLFTRDMSMLGAVLDEQDIPIEDLVTGVAKLVTIFHRGSHEAINFAATLNKLDLMSAATGRDILDVSTRMAGQAAIFGMKPHQTMALAAALVQAGVPRETAATSTGQLFMRMAGKKEPMFAQLAGMDPKAFSKLQLKDPLEALKALARGIQGLNPQQASQALENLSLDGERVRSVLFGLAQTLDVLDKYTEAAAAEWTGLGSLLRSFGEVGATTAAQLSLLWNNVQLTAAALGKSLLPVVRGFADGMRTILEDVREYLRANATYFESWGRSLAETMGHLGLLWREFPALIELGMLKGIVAWNRLVEVLRRSAVSLGGFLMDYFGKVATYLGAVLENKLKDVAEPLVGGLRPLLGAKVVNQMAADMGLGKRRDLRFLDMKPDLDFFRAGGKGGIPAGGMFAGLGEEAMLDPDQRKRLAEATERLARAERDLAAARKGQAVAEQAKDAVERAAAERAAAQAAHGRARDLANRAFANLRPVGPMTARQRAQAAADFRRRLNRQIRGRPARPRPAKGGPAARKRRDDVAARARAMADALAPKKVDPAAKARADAMIEAEKKRVELAERARKAQQAAEDAANARQQPDRDQGRVGVQRQLREFEEDPKVKAAREAQDAAMKRRREKLGLPALPRDADLLGPFKPPGDAEIRKALEGKQADARASEALGEKVAALGEKMDALKDALADVKRTGIDLRPGKTMWDNLNPA